MTKHFELSIPQDDLDDLHRRLAHTRFPNVPDGLDGKGFPIDLTKRLVERWRSGFDWRAVERRLNELHQLLVEVDGNLVHVVHERARKQDPEPGAEPGADQGSNHSVDENAAKVPVVLLHGWPDSFFGVHRLIGPLTAAGHDVIVPTLPGYGFSDQPAKSMSVADLATTIDGVLTRLGYERYAVHGGDWGGAVAEQLALSLPERVAAIHLLDVPYYHQFMVDTDDAKDDAEKAFLTAAGDWGDKGGYLEIQSTQPLTLAYGLADSPVGLLAWIGEKYGAWTDSRPADDDILTQACLYWFTNTIYSSMRLYAEGMSAWDSADWESGQEWPGEESTDWSAGAQGEEAPGETAAGAAADTASAGAQSEGEPGEAAADTATPAGAGSDAAALEWTDTAGGGWTPVCTVPAGFALFPADIGVPPRAFAERFFADIRRYSLMPTGGHFAAREQPEALAAEIAGFLAEL